MRWLFPFALLTALSTAIFLPVPLHFENSAELQVPPQAFSSCLEETLDFLISPRFPALSPFLQAASVTKELNEPETGNIYRSMEITDKIPLFMTWHAPLLTVSFPVEMFFHRQNSTVEYSIEAASGLIKHSAVFTVEKKENTNNIIIVREKLTGISSWLFSHFITDRIEFSHSHSMRKLKEIMENHFLELEKEINRMKEEKQQQQEENVKEENHPSETDE